MRIAALVKPVPAFPAPTNARASPPAMTVDPLGRRAIAQACELAAAVGDGSVTICTLGPPATVDLVRRAVVGARQANVACEGVLLCDPAFEGSDSLATARVLAAGVEQLGGFDLILTGRSAVDVSTGQVGPQLAELLGLPFAAGARYLALEGATVRARCEHDDGWAQLDVDLPAVVSCAERLIDPSAVGAAPDSASVRILTAADLGAGSWGAAPGSARVGGRRPHAVTRQRIVLEGSAADQVDRALAVLRERGALDPARGSAATDTVPPGQGERGVAVAVAVEPGRPVATRELLGAAARVAVSIDGHVVAIGPELPEPELLGSWGADAAVRLDGSTVEEDVAGALAGWARLAAPHAILASSTAWGCEIAARTAARLDAGLIGDASALDVDDTGRITGWKAVTAGQSEVAVTVGSSLQLATVRVGALAVPTPRAAGRPEVRVMRVDARSRARVRSRTRDDDIDALAHARTVLGVGVGVDRAEYPTLTPLLEALGAELAATRPVVDRRWQPHARQIGLTGRAIAPHLYVAVGLVGAPEHMIGVRAAGTVLGVHAVPDAPLFDFCDIGIIADWRAAVPLLAEALGAADVAAS